MSDSDELARLRADVNTLNQWGLDHKTIAEALETAQNRIAELETAADPWRKGKKFAETYRNSPSDRGDAAHYIDHLTAEVARLTARAKSFDSDLERARKKCNELYEAKRNAESQRDTALNLLAELESVKPVSDMQSPSEGPIVGFDPVLEPARVLATGLKLLESMFPWRSHTSPAQDAIDFVRRHTDASIKPYRLKGGESGS